MVTTYQIKVIIWISTTIVMKTTDTSNARTQLEIKAFASMAAVFQTVSNLDFQQEQFQCEILSL